MNHLPRGVALVINNIKFSDNTSKIQDSDCSMCFSLDQSIQSNIKLTKREGAEIDSENLKRVLSKLHFDVRLHHNQTKDDMLKLINEASDEDHSDADCFMCVVMSHGTKLEDDGIDVFGIDNQEIDIEAEAKWLFSDKNSPTLNDKPKLFFVDACWGEDKLAITNEFYYDKVYHLDPSV